MSEERVFSGEIVVVGECDKKSVPVRLALYLFSPSMNYRKGENLLRTICPFPTICHTYQPLAVNIPPPQVFVSKHFPTWKSACATGTIGIRDVAALNHEFGYNAMEG